MLTTLNKLEYLDETKQQIKNALNTKFNSQIQDTDTFRSYVSKISNIYTNWPKVTSENTSLSLTPTKKGLMALNLKGNTSQSGTPTPETPQDIHVVSGDNEIVVTGKNLFDGELELGTYLTNTGAKYNVTDTYRNANYVSINPNTTYTFSIDGTSQKYVLYFYDKNKTFLNYDNSLSNGTFMTPDKAYYVNFRCFSADFTSNYAKLKVQLEKGHTATDYEPYIAKSYPIYLGDIELCKIGDYQDYIYKDNNKWYIHKEIGKVVLNGSESWGVHGVIASWFYWDGLTNGFINNIISGYALSNYFTQKAYNNVTTINNGEFAYGQVGGETTKRLVIKNADYTKLADFKTWLSTHNTTVYYVLATPTYTEITDSTLISQLEALKIATSYDTQTNITQTNNDLPFIISASALMKGGN